LIWLLRVRPAIVSVARPRHLDEDAWFVTTLISPSTRQAPTSSKADHRSTHVATVRT